jgi:ABC-type lipoprotein export system ATPase subunit
MDGETSGVLEATGLYHIYREREVETVALRGAEIRLHAGIWTSVMGPSGSGKSTLVHVLGGLLEPSGGSVSVDGENLTQMSAADRAVWRRRRIGIVLQRDNLHPLLTAADNVSLPLRLDGKPRAETQSRAHELLARMGLVDRGNDLPRRLSGGESQRVAIATALSARPAVLLADELTGELDEASTASVLDLLEQLRGQEGMALLTVTHNPAVAARADRRLVMRDGLVVDHE